MERKTIILLVSLILIGLFLGEINEVTGEAFSGWRKKLDLPFPYLLRSISCTDSDDLDYYTSGTVTFTSRTGVFLKSSRKYNDNCADSKNLNEYYCQGEKFFAIQTYKCPNGCKNGACIKEVIPIEPTQKCGNNIVESLEECDDGSNNGIYCEPLIGKTCTYCSTDCKIRTVHGEIYCGNNVCDIDEDETNCPEDCLQKPTVTCKDSEGRRDIYTKGKVYGDLSSFGTGYEGKIGTVYDFCVQLREDGSYPWQNVQEKSNVWNRYKVQSCEKNCAIYEIHCKDNQILTVVPKCPNGCKDGACIKEEVPPTTKCTDSDGGLNLGIKGYCSEAPGDRVNDMCSGTTLIKEAFCDTPTHCNIKIYGCPANYECSNGACIVKVQKIPEPEIPPAPVDYLPVTIEYVDDIDLEDALSTMSTASKALYIHAPGINRFTLRIANYKKTSEIWIAKVDNNYGLFYRDIESVPDIKYANILETIRRPGYIYYKDNRLILEWVDDVDLSDSFSGMSTHENAIYILSNNDFTINNKQTREAWATPYDKKAIFYYDKEKIPAIQYLSSDQANIKMPPE